MNQTAMQEKMNLKLVKEVEKHPCLYKSDMVEYCRRSVTDKAWEQVGRVVGWPGPKCKIKYKNIRSICCRYKKLVDAGVKKRPYYLMEHMSFAFPYIKAFNEEENKNEETQPKIFINSLSYYDNLSQKENPFEQVKIENCSSQSNSSVQDFTENSSEPQDITKSMPISPSPPPSPARTTPDAKSAFKLTDITQSNRSDQSEPNTEMLVHTDSSNDLQNDPKKMFLLSLLPDIYAMNDTQTRKFKRHVLKLVDDILTDDPM